MTSSVLSTRFRDFIADSKFPCVGAKSALAKGQLTTIVARDIRSNWDDRHIYDGVTELVERYTVGRELFQSFAVIFEGPTDLDEIAFEEALWARAESLTNKDIWLGKPRDRRVSDDPSDPHFSLSFHEEAFFIVGLHPRASRPARRFDVPVLVFNVHDQFERLRDEGRYEKLRGRIMERDISISGSANPMLAQHGTSSEALQYSGRHIKDSAWRCPFRPVERAS